MRRVAIIGGEDWTDASVEHINVPADCDLEAAVKARNKWYWDEYCPNLKAGNNPKYLSLVDWLIAYHGATQNTDVEEFWA